LTSPVISASVRSTEGGADELFMLLGDRRVVVVSRLDTFTELGRAPEGTTALVALPGVNLQSPIAHRPSLLLAVKPRRASGSCGIVAWDRRGKPLWTATAAGLRGIDSLAFINWAGDRAELCAWQQGGPWRVVADSGAVSATPLNPGFTPLDALTIDLDRDSVPELVFFDGWHLVIYHSRQGRELRCRWPDLPLAGGPKLGPRRSRPLIAGAFFDSAGVLLALTGDTLRYIDVETGAEKCRFAADSSSALPGPMRAVCASGSTACVVGTSRQGGDYIVRLGPSGPSRALLRLPRHVEVHDLAMLKDWPMLRVGINWGPENVFVYAPSLASDVGNQPGYTGVRLLRVQPLRFDGDTFPDLVVLRTAADAHWRVDAFTSHLGSLTRELEQARQALQRAALGRDRNEVTRAFRRVEALTAQIGPGATVTETDRLSRYLHAIRRRISTAHSAALLVFCLAAALAVLLWRQARRGVGPAAQQIENKPLPTRVALAGELVAVEHNFMSKGNTPAAIERLIETRDRLGLGRDRDFARLSTPPAEPGPFVRDIYVSAISRLIDSTPTLPLLDLIEKTARSAPRGRDVETLELSLEEYRRREPDPGFRIFCIANREYPDIYHNLRIFANPELRSTVEHIILDHIRHARSWAVITLRYVVNTQWNRRLLVQLLSDSPHVIPLGDERAHITSQLTELATMLRPAIEVPTAGEPPADTNEKLWVKIADYISVLEEARLRAP